MHTKENMLDYVINLFEDALDFSWSSAKACHAVLLCRMEQGEKMQVGMILKKLTEFVVPMLSDMWRLPTVPRGIRTGLLLPKPTLAFIITKAPVVRSNLMKRRVCFISTFA